MSRFKNVVVVVALIFSIGLHWPILQSLAWINMLVSYSQEDGLERAIVKTFDGKHPCNLCHFVEAGQETEKKDAKHLSIKKIDLISESRMLELFGPDISIPAQDSSATISLVYYSPPTPPPNLA